MVNINRVAVDLYSEDIVTDLRAAKAAGIDLIIHKASEGVTIQDHSYDHRRALARDAGILWAAYHFGRGTPVDAQIENFLKVAQPDDQTRLVLDWEVPYMSADQAREFVTKLDAKIGRPTVLYSYDSFLKEQLGENRVDAFLGAHPLWIARYSSLPYKLQPSWQTSVLWQFTDGVAGPLPHSVPGIPGAEGDVDANHSDMDLETFRQFWSGSLANVVAPVAPGEPWDKLTYTLAADGTMRIAWIQDTLSKLGFGVLRIDGVSGNNTRKALKVYQAARGLRVDGVTLLGGETELRLKADLAALAK